MTATTKTVFLGSPAVAIPSLRALAAHGEVELAGVVTQPDMPAGRRRALRACPVKEAAQSMGLPVFSPAKIGDPESLAQLRQWGVQLAVVCAYGQIFPEAVLGLPPLGCYNLHFSLLPRWRGASPVQAAILAGDAETGVTLQRMTRELDAGDIAAATPSLPIAPEDTSHTLGGRLAEAAADLLRQAVSSLISGRPPLTPQDAERATFCRIIKKAAGAVDFQRENAVDIERKCRAYTPWPGCHAFLGGRRLGLEQVALAAAPAAGDSAAAPGVVQPGGIVAARGGALRLVRVRPEGKGAMDWKDYANGNPGAIGAQMHPAPQ